MAGREKMKDEAEHARQQQLERFRYQAELARSVSSEPTRTTASSPRS
jgi:hypothetical protein